MKASKMHNLLAKRTTFKQKAEAHGIPILELHVTQFAEKMKMQA